LAVPSSLRDQGPGRNPRSEPPRIRLHHTGLSGWPDRAAFFQIGDGAIIVSNRAEPDDYGWVFWPQHGEFANQTNFITQDNALEVLEFELEERCIDEIAMFTDGIERLVLDLQQKIAHAPFFRPLFRWLVKTEPAAISAEILESEVVSRYLGSKQVNDRTDDDKTLILASRRSAPTTQDLGDAGSEQSETCTV
jgi:Protein phosphatase 2C